MDIMRFPQITHAIENNFEGNRAFLCENLDRAVEQCAGQAAQYQKAATLTLKITFTPEAESMIIAADLDTKLPRPKPFPIHAWVDREGRLYEEDPRQQKLDLKVAPITKDGGDR